jgi:uncharacterized Zn-binding protein involved in type VI secretion
MPKAVRRGDATAHGAKLGPGPASPNVNIGSSPAWRAALAGGGGAPDVHQCPASNGTSPHGIGVVPRGSLTVRINGLAATRVGDQVMETNGGPDPITSGCESVNIG